MNELSRKDEIKQVACNLFKEKGYSAVTVRDIAAYMGIKAASLYNHIASKQEILSRIIMEQAYAFTSGMEAISTSQSSSEAQIRAVIKQHVSLTLQNPNGMACLNNDWMHLEGDLDHFLRLRKEYEENFRNIIKQGVTRGELATIEIEVVVFSVLNTLRNLYIWVPKKPNMTQEQLVIALSKVILQGVTK